MDSQTSETLPDGEQQRLTRLLDSVRLERPVEVDEPTPPPVKACPSCLSEEPWGNSSWCPTCGYYPKLGRAVFPEEIQEAEPDGVDDRRILGNSVSSLLWVGIALIVALDAWISLSNFEVGTRGEWALAQLALGAFIFLAAHIRCFMVASERDTSTGFSALWFGAGPMWWELLKDSRCFRWTVNCGGWGMCSMILALAVVGLDWNGLLGSHKRSAKRVNPMQAVMKVAGASQSGALSSNGEAMDPLESNADSAGGSGGGSTTQPMEDALQDFAADAGADALSEGAGSSASGSSSSQNASERMSATDDGPADDAQNDKSDSVADGDDAAQTQKSKAGLITNPGPIPPNALGQARNEQAEFVVFGYLANPTGEVRSILLAEVVNQRGRFVCRLSLDECDEAVRQQLQQALVKYRTARQPLPAPYNAHWVTPIIRCKVAYSGKSGDGTVSDGYLVQAATAAE